MIEFIEGEEHCRYNGVIMTPDNCEKLYGYSGEFDILDDDTYLIDGVIYTNKKFKDLLKVLGTVNGSIEEYDEILSQGRGFDGYCTEKKFENTLIIPLSELEDYEEVKPFEDFKKDYPDLNVEKYIEFMDSLDEYYSQIYEH